MKGLGCSKKDVDTAGHWALLIWEPRCEKNMTGEQKAANQEK